MTDPIYEELRRLERSGKGRVDMVTAETPQEAKMGGLEIAPQDKKGVECNVDGKV